MIVRILPECANKRGSNYTGYTLFRFSLKQKQRCVGRQEEHAEQIRKLKVELQDDMYKDAEQKYKDKMIALRVRRIDQTSVHN